MDPPPKKSAAVASLESYLLFDKHDRGLERERERERSWTGSKHPSRIQDVIRTWSIVFLGMKGGVLRPIARGGSD